MNRERTNIDPCSLYGVLLDNINIEKSGERGKASWMLTNFISFLQGQEGIVRSYQFNCGESRVDNYIPSPDVCGIGQFSLLSQFPSLA